MTISYYSHENMSNRNLLKDKRKKRDQTRNLERLKTTTTNS